jgi:hypothetical protein
MWMDDGSPEKKITLDQYATELADIAFAALPKIEYKTDVPLVMAETKLLLYRREPSDKRIEWARETMSHVKDGKVQTQQEIYAREAIFLHDEPKRDLKLQTIKIGGAAVCALPNEVFAITGLWLKSSNVFTPTMVIELANGAEGYIPPADQHALGGYTTWPARTAALEILAEDKIVRQLEKMLATGEPPRPFRGQPQPPVYTQQILKSAPRGYWPCDGFAPNRTLVQKNTNTRFEVGVAYHVPGKVGASVQFAGGRMSANLSDLGPTYTAEFWFWNGFPTDTRPVTGWMFSRGEDGAKDAPGDHLGLAGAAGHASKLIFFNGNAKNQTLAGSTPLKLREWRHVALVRDGRKVAVYLDGQREFDGEAAVTVPAGCGQLFFGGRNDKAYGFEGRFDEAAIYNRALTAKEIADHVAAAGKK